MSLITLIAGLVESRLSKPYQSVGHIGQRRAQLNNYYINHGTCHYLQHNDSLTPYIKL
ncbi:hypothetical protein DPMN_024952 [Dreissena polymorpha]|uniref:Uncharacterized protein n=1 Tax=Dreissena polymorpha TaxID=45954 RepID=A0A9D4LNW2_DREPO|nr:hypothetical protein DPMN_024952 [Dreissena polymorpha]